MDELWIEFEKAYPGLTAIQTDWHKARFEWSVRDGLQKLAAIEAVRDADPAYVKLPQNYLRSREWTRPERPEPRSKVERLMDSI